MGIKDFIWDATTDSPKEIKLKSEMVYAEWRTGYVPIGSMAPLEVVTSFVGNGNKVEIKAKSAGGKSLGKIKGIVNFNRFIGEIQVPDSLNPGEHISFEAKISALGLSGESASIPVGPPIEVSNLSWNTDTIRRGDMVNLTADVAGAPNGAEATIHIFQYDDNQIYDPVTQFPTVITDGKLEAAWQFDFPGRTKGLSTKEDLEPRGRQFTPFKLFFAVKLYGTMYGKDAPVTVEFQDFIEFQLFDKDGRPAADESFTVHLADGSTQDGSTDSDGRARIDDIPPGPYRIEFENVEYIGPIEARK